jgi:uncharacterized protein YukE
VEVLALNRAKFSPWAGAFCKKVNATINQTQQYVDKLEEVRQRALENNLTNLVNLIERMQNRARNNVLNTTWARFCSGTDMNEVPGFNAAAIKLKTDLHDLRQDIAQIAQDVNRINWSNYRRTGNGGGRR